LFAVLDFINPMLFRKALSISIGGIPVLSMNTNTDKSRLLISSAGTLDESFINYFLAAPSL